MNATVAVARADRALDETSVEFSQYLTFGLDGEMYSLSLGHVREIIECRNVSTVPLMPGFVRGIINLRGSVIPVIDLAARFGGAPSTLGKRTVILILELIVEGAQQIYGVIVDSVSDVLALAATDIEPAPAFGTKLRNEYIAGVAKVNGKVMIILDISTMLNLDE